MMKFLLVLLLAPLGIMGVTRLLWLEYPERMNAPIPVGYCVFLLVSLLVVSGIGMLPQTKDNV